MNLGEGSQNPGNGSLSGDRGWLAAGRGRRPDEVGQLSHGVVDVDDRASRHVAAEEQSRQLRDQYGLDVSLDGTRAVGRVVALS